MQFVSDINGTAICLFNTVVVVHMHRHDIILSSPIYTSLYRLNKRCFSISFVVMIIVKAGKYQHNLPRDPLIPKSLFLRSSLRLFHRSSSFSLSAVCFSLHVSVKPPFFKNVIQLTAADYSSGQMWCSVCSMILWLCFPHQWKQMLLHISRTTLRHVRMVTLRWLTARWESFFFSIAALLLKRPAFSFSPMHCLLVIKASL